MDDLFQFNKYIHNLGGFFIFGYFLLEFTKGHSFPPPANKQVEANNFDPWKSIQDFTNSPFNDTDLVNGLMTCYLFPLFAFHDIS